MIGHLLTVEVPNLKPGDRFVSTHWTTRKARTETVVEIRPNVNNGLVDVVTDHDVYEMDTCESIEVWRA